MLQAPIMTHDTRSFPDADEHIQIADSRLRKTVLGLIALLSLCTSREVHASPVFVDKPCDIPVADDTVRERLRCGTVSVPRDPANPDAGTFDLAVVVRRSATPSPGFPPVLILHGGPGGEQTRYMGMSAADFVPGRDSIAFDMRGGGRSRPVVCTTLPGALLAAYRRALAGEDASAARQAAMATCAAEFAAAGLAPSHFGTERNVEDAVAVRQALGIQRWAVYGMSYGTTVAAEYLARHPDEIESVVLDSLYPPDTFVPTVREAQGRAIARLLGDCARDAACAARFPGLDRARADAALARLADHPLVFHINGQPYRANELAVRVALLGLFYTEATARSVPWFIDAVVRGDGDAIAGPLGMPVLAEDLMASSFGSMGGLFATDCRDRARHHVVNADPGPSWIEMYTGIHAGACKAWPLGTPPGLPSGTNVPVLVLSAGYDPFQPDGAAVAAAIGPAALPLTIPLAAHVVHGAGDCPRGIINEFIKNPGKTPSISCLGTMTAPPFLLEARPLPAMIALGAAMQAGSLPPPALMAIAGLVLLMLSWVWQRARGASASPATGRSSWGLAIGAGLLALTGAAIPPAVTLSNHPGAAIIGLEPMVAQLLWAIPLGGILALLALIVAWRQRHWSNVAAAFGGVMIATGALLLGFAPWA